MPVSYNIVTGGNVVSGVQQPLLNFTLTLPDTYSGQNFTFSGIIMPVGPTGGLSSAIALTGSPIALPSVPASGTTYWLLQANLSTGAVTLLTSSTATPTVSSGCQMLASGAIGHTDTVPWNMGVAAATVSGGSAPTFPDLC